MKRFLFVLLTVILLACESDQGTRNPYLQEVSFRFDINLNLPLYSPLTNIGNAVYIGSQGIGTRGVFVIKSGIDTYSAFEASCPNHVPNSCSTMELGKSKQTAKCSCEDYEYSLFTGQLFDRPNDGNRYYDMLFYRTTFNGNTVTVSN